GREGTRPGSMVTPTPESPTRAAAEEVSRDGHEAGSGGERSRRSVSAAECGTAGCAVCGAHPPWVDPDHELGVRRDPPRDHRRDHETVLRRALEDRNDRRRAGPASRDGAEGPADGAVPQTAAERADERDRRVPGAVATDAGAVPEAARHAALPDG